MRLQATELQGWPATPEAKRKPWKSFSPRAIRTGTALPTLWSGTSSLQNGERTNLCCFMLLSLRCSVVEALGHEYAFQLQEGQKIRPGTRKGNRTGMQSKSARVQGLHHLPGWALKLRFEKWSLLSRGCGERVKQESRLYC